MVGWDIGGAHVKAALIRNGRLEAVRQWPCALWQGLHCLDPVLDDALGAWSDVLGAEAVGNLEHAVTMTGEMVDAFDGREDGVTRLVLHLRQRLGASLRLFCGSGEWIDSAAAADRWEELASANWAATARFVANRLNSASLNSASLNSASLNLPSLYAPLQNSSSQAPAHPALLVDIGSTTTDFVPLAAGRVLAEGYGDRQRLHTGELLYQGVVRTPLCALAQRIPFGGRHYNVMNEWFASTADVYRLTGELDSAHDQHPAADGGSKTIEGSCRRIARMIGHDAPDAQPEDWIAFAHEWRRLQVSLLQSGMRRVAMQQEPAPPEGEVGILIGAGCGSFLVRALAQLCGCRYLGFDELVDSPPALRSWVQVCAPAVALAFLHDSLPRAAS